MVSLPDNNTMNKKIDTIKNWINVKRNGTVKPRADNLLASYVIDIGDLEHLARENDYMV